MNSRAAILICTKDRPVYLERTLNCILNSKLTNVGEILVVDGSTDEGTKLLCQQLSTNNQLIKINWIHTDGGKPTALNLGFKQLQAFELIHCLDDDITIPEEYFKVLEQFFFEHLEIVGVAPLIKNRSLPTQHSVNNKNAGRITKYGINYWFNEFQDAPDFQYSEWLPGGACSYRSSVLQKVIASNVLHNPNVNYALGDDVDLSLQASKAGLLACVTSLEVIHEEAPSLTSSSKILEMDIARANWKIYLWRHHPERISLTRVLTWDFFSGIYHILKRDQHMTSVRLFKYFRALSKAAWSRTRNFRSST